MCTKPNTVDSESDFMLNGDPVELDYLLASNLPHEAEDEDLDPEFFDEEDSELNRYLDDLEAEAAPCPVTDSVPAKRGRPKAGAGLAPATTGADGQPLSIYQRLVDYGLLRKITDIVMAKVAIPWHLRSDAAQEVHAAWAALAAKPEYQRNQLARYAYMSGQHAALKLRRTIGAVVVIPGALFRTGRDSTFMEAIGAAVNPKDVDDYKDSIELSIEPVDTLRLARVSEQFFEERLGDLQLSAKQSLVARKALIEKMAVDDIADELNMDLMYVERLMNQVTKKLLAKDAGDAATPVTAASPAQKSRPQRNVKDQKVQAKKAGLGTETTRLSGRPRQRKKVTE